MRIAALILFLLPLGGKAAGPGTAGEYKVKAVFLFNFSQFVAWPKEAFASADAPLVIGILGEDPFGAYLDQAVAGEVVGGRRLVVERYSQVDEVKICHILFISASEAGKLGQILAALKGRSMLTASDLDGFARGGGMIQLLNENNHIGMQINLHAAKAADLTISSKLLRRGGLVTVQDN